MYIEYLPMHHTKLRLIMGTDNAYISFITLRSIQIINSIPVFQRQQEPHANSRHTHILSYNRIRPCM